MKKRFIVCSLVAALIGVMAFNAEAIPIYRAISSGGPSITDYLELSPAMAFTTISNGGVSAARGHENYTAAISGQTASFMPLPLRPFSLAGLTYSFDATALTIGHGSYRTMGRQKPVSAHITGVDDTSANWYFGANGDGETADFSLSADLDLTQVTAATIPEPAVMLLLGSGLVGLGTVARRRFK